MSDTNQQTSSCAEADGTTLIEVEIGFITEYFIMAGKGDTPRPIKDKEKFGREFDRIFGKKKKEGFCYCAIGAGGNPCISREFCDANKDKRWKENHDS